MSTRARYPFTAIVGQDALLEALLVCAVNPAVGGVLVRGERGTAKTTAVRALAAALGEIAVVDGCAYACDPAAPDPLCADGPHAPGAASHTRPVALCELPVNATADRVAGSLDVAEALGSGTVRFAPGVLAAAHRGVLYVDEVNLLADHLVDVLLDAAASGVNRVERDGVGITHAARFELVGTMNPEEGDLRPQLLDRFGLGVEVGASLDPAVRGEVVRRRLAFDADPAAFAERFAEDEAALGARVAAARARLERVVLSDAMVLAIATACAKLGVDGMRADLATAQAARALAALDDEAAVTLDHVRRAARLALAHRRRRGPLDQPGLSEQELDDALGAPEDEPPTPPTPPTDGSPGSERTPEPSRDESTSPGDVDSSLDATYASAGGAGDRAGAGAGAPLPTQVQAPGEALGAPPVLTLLGRGDGPAGRRGRRLGHAGLPVGDRAAGPGDRVAVLPTLRAGLLAGRGPRSARCSEDGETAPPAPAGADAGPTAEREPLRAEDLRTAICEDREGALVVFCVDASGSVGARKRMAQVKAAALGVLTDAYQRRDRVALVSFGGDGARVLLEPTSSVERAAEALRVLPTGGTTPLRAGLEATQALLRRAGATGGSGQTGEAGGRRGGRAGAGARRAIVLLLTDGRANTGGDPRAAIVALARDVQLTVLDTERGPMRMGGAAALAAAAGAPVLSLDALDDLTPTRRSAA